MRVQSLRDYIVYFFVVAFLSLKVSGLHVFTHDGDDGDDVENCDICELVSISNFTPAIDDGVDNNITNNFLFVFNNEVGEYYGHNYSNILNIFSLYSRPPPSL